MSSNVRYNFALKFNAKKQSFSSKYNNMIFGHIEVFLNYQNDLKTNAWYILELQDT